MKFKDFFKRKLVSEVSDKTMGKIDNNLKSLLAKKRLPFDNLFGDKFRIAEPLKVVSAYHQKIKNNIYDNEFDLDFEKWVGYKLTDKDKKNPIRIGKLLNKRKLELEKMIKDGEQNKHLNPQLYEININTWKNNLNEINDLLKVSDLQKSYKDSQNSGYVVIYSRAPVDVVRMSDHTWSSCHSEGGDYFYCALADASCNAGIAYLVNKTDYESIADRLQEDEIFSDSDRDVNGIVPVARIRIRSVIDSEGNSLAVPSLKVYSHSNNGPKNDFAKQLTEWAKRQNIDKFNFDKRLTLKGGSYEDYKYDVKTMIKDIWGIDISYKADTSDEEDFRTDLDADNNHEEEQWADQERENFDPEKIYEEAFGRNYHELFSIEYDINDGTIQMSYDIPDDVIALIEKTHPNGSNHATVSFKCSSSSSSHRETEATINLNTQIVKFDFEDVNVNFYDYAEYYGNGEGNFHDSGLIRAVANILENTVNGFTGEILGEGEVGMYELRNLMNKKICDSFDVPYETLSWDEIQDFYNDYVKPSNRDYALFEGKIPSFPYKLEKIQYVNEITVSPDAFKTLFETKEEIEGLIYQEVTNKFPKLKDNLISFLQSSFSVPGEYYTQDIGDKGVRSDSYYNKKTIRFVKTNTQYNKYILKMDLYNNEPNEMNDSGLLETYYKAMNYIRDEFIPDNVEGFFGLLDYLKKNVKKPDNLKDQGQMELDLSHHKRLNINMNKFDFVINKLLEDSRKGVLLELEQGKGGVSNQSGGQAQNPVNQAGVQNTNQPATNVNPNTTGNPTPPTTQPQNTNNPAATTATTNPNTNNPQDEHTEFSNLLTMQKQNPEQFNKQAQVLARDPERFSRFINFLSQPMNG